MSLVVKCSLQIHEVGWEVGFQPQHQWEALKTDIKEASTCLQPYKGLCPRAMCLMYLQLHRADLKLFWPGKELGQIRPKILPSCFSVAPYSIYLLALKIKLLRLFSVARETTNFQVMSQHTRKYMNGYEGQIFIINSERKNTVIV